MSSVRTLEQQIREYERKEKARAQEDKKRARTTDMESVLASPGVTPNMAAHARTIHMYEDITGIKITPRPDSRSSPNAIWDLEHTGNFGSKCNLHFFFFSLQNVVLVAGTNLLILLSISTSLFSDIQHRRDCGVQALSTEGQGCQADQEPSRVHDGRDHFRQELREQVLLETDELQPRPPVKTNHANGTLAFLIVKDSKQHTINTKQICININSTS